MSEGLKTRCEDCDLVFDKVLYPDCPRCRHRRRQGRAAAGGPTTGSNSEPSSRWPRTGLRGVALVLTGAVLALVSLNLMSGRGWNDSPLTVMTVPLRVEVPRECPQAGPAPPNQLAPAVGAGHEALRLGEWTAKVDGRTGMLQLEGRVSNVASVSIRGVELRVTSHDAMGQVLSEARGALNPGVLGPSESAPFQLTLRDDRAIERLLFTGLWSQELERALAESPLSPLR